MARSVADTALLLAVVEGYDPSDPTSRKIPDDRCLGEIRPQIEGLKLGIPADYFWDDLDSEVDALVRSGVATMCDLGATTVDLPRMEWGSTFRASGRMLVADAAAVHHDRLLQHPEMYGEDIVERLETGAKVPGPHYAEARREQALWKRKLERVFEDVDLIATATTSEPARLIESAEGVSTAKTLTALTAPFNLTGVPAISVPCGFTAAGLPVGLQLVAPWWREHRLLCAARAFEEATQWGERTPAL
jgi:aspartyl-tRNA(Asn)/glutamyl-tRNA(Gln) amidotransferase subunit A